MKLAVEAWATEYGATLEIEGREASGASVDLSVETAPSLWAPISPANAVVPAADVLFSDGVRRIDARVWIGTDDDRARPGICASYAAGAVRCDGRAKLVAVDVRRGLFCAPNRHAGAVITRYGSYPVRNVGGDSPEELSVALQDHMGALEVELAAPAGAELVVVDGPLSGRQQVPDAIGYIKTHHVAYLPPELEPVIGALRPGQRTPLFLTTSRYSRFSWYLRLPGATGHPWAGVVRCESSADADVGATVALADRVAATLVRFASEAHKDPRAPQNLYPIAGLERELRRRLGDPALLYRGLRAAAAAA